MGDYAKASRLEASLDEMEFTSTADVDAFFAEHEIKHGRSHGTWTAEYSWYQGIVDKLHGEYTRLHRRECRAELERLLCADPGDSYRVYLSTLNMLYKESRAEDLADAVAARIAEFEEDALREEIAAALGNDNFDSRRRYIRELEQLLETAPAELKPAIEKRITEQRAIEGDG